MENPYFQYVLIPRWREAELLDFRQAISEGISVQACLGSPALSLSSRCSSSASYRHNFG
jgi:hypothetical protein